MNIKYMRNDLEDQYGFLKLQDNILEIMVYINQFCTENQIEYCLMGGSALGAKRHGGFIPWDDDLDIFMTAENYAKFRRCFSSDGDHQKYYLQEGGAVDGMVTLSKIRMNDTTYLEKSLKDMDIHHGIYVDILILQVCPNNPLLQLRQCIWAKYALMKGLAARGYSEKKGIIGIALKIMALFPEYHLVRYALKQVYRYNGKETNYYSYFLGRAGLKEGKYKKEWFEKTVYCPFETVQLRVPIGLHDFLTRRFGNYMEIPDRAKIKSMQHAYIWDTENDFRKYTGQVGSAFTEEHILLG